MDLSQFLGEKAKEKLKLIKKYSKEVICLNCGKKKIPFAKKLVENQFRHPDFKNTCISCAVKQIRNNKAYNEEYKRIANLCEV